MHQGKIDSLESFSDSADNPPALRIMDPEKKKQLCYVPFAEFGTNIEPELIDFRGDCCYYADCCGNLYTIEENAYV